MNKCPKCGSCRINSYKHPNAKVWCMECDFILRDEGATEFNSYPDELKEAPYNPDDLNMVLLTEEHLQRVVKEAVCAGVEEYFKKTGIERLLVDIDLD